MIRHKYYLPAVCVLSSAMLLFSPMLQAQPPAPATQPAAPAGPLAPAMFKNIQVLTDVPADQLLPLMHYFTAALGRTCADCHQTDRATGTIDYSADTRAKTTARQMIKMVNTINAGGFGVRANCGTCHQGHSEPEGLRPATMMSSDEILQANMQEANMALREMIPQPAQAAGGPGGGAAGAPRAAGGPGGGATGAPRAAGGPGGGAPGGGGGFGRRQQPGPPVAEVLKKYTDALGVATSPIESRELFGTVTTREAQAMPFSVTQKGKMYVQTIEAVPAVQTSGFDGTAGWSKVGDKVGRLNAGGYSLDAAFRIADAGLAADIQAKYKDLESTKRSQMTLAPGSAPVDVNILRGVSGQTTEQFYFDANSGLLLRHVTTIATPLNGSLVDTVDYGNYRAEGGVMMPYKITHTDWNTLDTYTISRVSLNGTVPDSSFRKP